RSNFRRRRKYMSRCFRAPSWTRSRMPGRRRRSRGSDMALFMDGTVSGIEDLTAQDSQLLDVAQVENIDVTQKLALAQDELAIELNTLLTRLSYTEQPFWYTAPPRIATVVVTPPLK